MPVPLLHPIGSLCLYLTCSWSWSHCSWKVKEEVVCIHRCPVCLNYSSEKTLLVSYLFYWILCFLTWIFAWWCITKFLGSMQMSVCRQPLLTGEFHWFLTLPLSSQFSIYFKTQKDIFSVFSMSLGRCFKMSCPFGNQWRHWSSEELQTVYPSPYPSHSRQASALFVLRGISGSGGYKTFRYWKLHK